MCALPAHAANNFERGRRDDFVVQGSDVGELQSIVIGHDNSGKEPHALPLFST